MWGATKLSDNWVCLEAIIAKLMQYNESCRNGQKVRVVKKQAEISSKYYHSEQSTYRRCQSERTSVKLGLVGRSPHEGEGIQKVD